jgi:hypothetical protein
MSIVQAAHTGALRTSSSVPQASHAISAAAATR